MTGESATAAFAAFRATVLDDHRLLLRLRPSQDREAYVALVVAVGAERGFVFDETCVRAALREGEMAWLMQGADTA